MKVLGNVNPEGNAAQWENIKYVASLFSFVFLFVGDLTTKHHHLTPKKSFFPSSRKHIGEHANSTPEEKLNDILETLKNTHTEKNQEAWATIRSGCEEILQAKAGFEPSVKSFCRLLAGIHPADTNFAEWEAIRAAASE